MSVTQIVPALLTDLRDAAASAYDSPDPSIPVPVPTAVIRHEGPATTVDKPNLLVASLVSLGLAFAGPPEQCATVLRPTLNLTVTRNLPNHDQQGNTAPEDDLLFAGLSLAADISLLWYTLTTACRAGNLWSSFLELDCADTHFGDARPGASGGIGWWTFPITVAVTAPLRLP